MTFDHYLSTNPADDTDPEFRFEDEEEEIPEPTVEEVWDGGRSEYVHTVTFASGYKYTVRQVHGGAFSGDFAVIGQSGGIIGEGFLSAEEAIDWLCAPDRLCREEDEA